MALESRGGKLMGQSCFREELQSQADKFLFGGEKEQ